MTNSTDKTFQEWTGAGASKVTLALLFTDIVGSTGLGNTLGDDKWIELLMKHFERARSLTAQYDCYEIKVIGDSFMVAFHTVHDALQLAIDFYCNTGDPRLRIRAGIHVGQVRIIGNDIFGRMVNYTSRVEHSMEVASIILSNSAKEDVEGVLGSESKSIHFFPRRVEMKGFDRPQNLWRVATRDMRLADKERNMQISQGGTQPTALGETKKSSKSLPPALRNMFTQQKQEGTSQPVSEQRPGFELRPRKKD